MRIITVVFLFCALLCTSLPVFRASTVDHQPLAVKRTTYEYSENVPYDGLDGDKLITGINPKNLSRAAGNHTRQKSQRSDPPMIYHGGKMMTGDVRVHTLFIGTDFYTNDFGILEAYLDGSRTMPWYKITRSYYNPRKNDARAGYIRDDDWLYWYDFEHGGDELPKNLGDKEIKKMLKFAINKGYGAGLNNDVYLIMLDHTYRYPGLCTESCGYHSYMNVYGRPVLYSVIGNPFNCVDRSLGFDACSALNQDGSNSPNGPNNVEFDSMVNIVAHELSEIVTDPYGTAWYDENGLENADKCEWEFSNIQTTEYGVCTESVYGYCLMIQKNFNLDTIDGCPVGCTNGYSLCQSGCIPCP